MVCGQKRKNKINAEPQRRIRPERNLWNDPEKDGSLIFREPSFLWQRRRNVMFRLSVNAAPPESKAWTDLPLLCRP